MTDPTEPTVSLEEAKPEAKPDVKLPVSKPAPPEPQSPSPFGVHAILSTLANGPLTTSELRTLLRMPKDGGNALSARLNTLKRGGRIKQNKTGGPWRLLAQAKAQAKAQAQGKKSKNSTPGRYALVLAALPLGSKELRERFGNQVSSDLAKLKKAGRVTNDGMGTPWRAITKPEAKAQAKPLSAPRRLGSLEAKIITLLARGPRTLDQLRKATGKNVGSTVTRLKQHGDITNGGTGQPWRLTSKEPMKLTKLSKKLSEKLPKKLSKKLLKTPHPVRVGLNHQILKALAQRPQSLVELQARLGPKISPAINTLRHQGWVTREPGAKRGSPWWLTEEGANATGLLAPTKHKAEPKKRAGKAEAPKSQDSKAGALRAMTLSERILTVLARGPLVTRDIQTHMGGPKGSIASALSALKAAGKVVQEMPNTPWRLTNGLGKPQVGRPPNKPSNKPSKKNGAMEMGPNELAMRKALENPSAALQALLGERAALLVKVTKLDRTIQAYTENLEED